VLHLSEALIPASEAAKQVSSASKSRQSQNWFEYRVLGKH
jgi:hypothetical protein